MKLYKTTLRPRSAFASVIKGDTFWGHLCWGIKYSLSEDRLKNLLKTYRDGRPFLIVSDAFAKGYLPKPKMPPIYLKENIDQKKKNKKKVWLTLEELQSGEFHKAKRDEDVYAIKDKSITVIRNSINYKTFTTDSGTFAPYGVDEYYLNEKDLYFLLDEEQLRLNELEEALHIISQIGFGKDTTIGKGRFDFTSFQELNIDFHATTYMALSPFVITTNEEIKRAFYEPFTRFGKFGLERAYENPFKNYVLLANSAAIIEYKEKKYRQFIGKAIEGISKTYQDALIQGYAILLPIKDLS